jgi:hypothetical protein
MAQIRTGSGGTWDTDKAVRTSMRISNPKLTGKFEDHDLLGTGNIESMLEVDHDFGTDYIWEQFISQ